MTIASALWARSKEQRKQFLKLPLTLSLWCVVSLVTGILMSHTGYRSLLVGIPLILTTAWLLLKKKKLPPRFLVASCFLLLGSYRYADRVKGLTESAEYMVTTSTNHPLKGTGTILSSKRCSGRHGICISLRIKHLANAHLPPHRLIIFYLRFDPLLKPGDTISFSSLVVRRQKSPEYLWYLFKEGSVASVFCDTLDAQLLHRPTLSFSRACFHIQNRFMQIVSKKLSGQTLILFLALFIGKKSPNHQYHSLHSSFSQWGIVHYLARSGLHVIVLVSLWYPLMRLIARRGRASTLLITFLLWIYYILSCPSISFIRACSTFFLYQGFTLGKLTVQPLHVISLTTLGILLVNPLQLFFLDFQLSFSLTAALALHGQIRHQMRVANAYCSSEK